VRRGLVVAGEIGLAGDVRPVPHLARRLAEAARLGFEAAVVADPAPETVGIAVTGVPSLLHAIDAAGLPHPDVPDRRAQWRPDRHPRGGPCHH